MELAAPIVMWFCKSRMGPLIGWLPNRRPRHICCSFRPALLRRSRKWRRSWQRPWSSQMRRNLRMLPIPCAGVERRKNCGSAWLQTVRQMPANSFANRLPRSRQHRGGCALCFRAWAITTQRWGGSSIANNRPFARRSISAPQNWPSIAAVTFAISSLLAKTGPRPALI